MARSRLFGQISHLVGEALREQSPSLRRMLSDNSPATDFWSQPLSRRDFLRLGGATFAAAALAPLTDFTRPASAQTQVPIVIVGGGAAGLVTAYRLRQQGLPCIVYEASNRLGGRMFTKSWFNAEGMFCEMGGELVDTGHTDLINLCSELGLSLDHFDETDTGLAKALFYFGGRIYTDQQAAEAFKPLAALLAKDLKMLFPDGEVVVPTYKNPGKATHLDAMSLEAYLEAKRTQIPEASRWMIDLLKVAYTGEYGRQTSEQSALNLLLLIKPEKSDFAAFGDSDEAMRIKGGSSRLIDALVEKLWRDIPLMVGHRLTSIGTRRGQLKLRFRHGAEWVDVNANRVVLALPFAVLRQVAGIDMLELSAVKLRAIRELGYGFNTKQMLGFKSRYWRINDCCQQASAGEIFTDQGSQAFWETSRMQSGQSGILTNFIGGDAGRNATPGQWEKSLKDLNKIDPQANGKFDGNLAFFNWSDYRHSGGSYTCPLPGQYTTLGGAAGEPELNNSLFFAGEHCSIDWQGYMNGAVQSGNLAAGQIMVSSDILQKQIQNPPPAVF